jgi:hypothetical protein
MPDNAQLQNAGSDRSRIMQQRGLDTLSGSRLSSMKPLVPSIVIVGIGAITAEQRTVE